jgi:hypothetical protein
MTLIFQRRQLLGTLLHSLYMRQNCSANSPPAGLIQTALVDVHVILPRKSSESYRLCHLPPKPSLVQPPCLTHRESRETSRLNCALVVNARFRCWSS